jgi:L-ascorbate oxidase
VANKVFQHWHGLALRMAPFADGSETASQWPIPPGHFFDYEVATVPEDGGTYFYHSHVGMQALTAYGPLVVEDCNPESYPHYYDEEMTLLWGDYFNKTDEVLETGLESVPFVWSGETNGVLLNGVGVGLGHQPNEEGSDASCTLPVIEVEPGKTYRMRWIGGTALTFLVAQLEGHHQPFTIIQVDGGEFTAPVSTERMQLGSGQRFDVLFKAKTISELAASGNNKTDFYLQYETRERPALLRSYAIVRYLHTECPSKKKRRDAIAAPPKIPTLPPVNITNTTYDWLEYKLQPLTPKGPGKSMPSLDEITRRVVIETWQIGDEHTDQTIWVMNNLTWVPEDSHVPMLVDVYERGQEALPDYEVALKNGGWDPRVKAFAAMPGEVLEIVFQNHGSLWNANGGVDVHPFHAHGQHYFDIGSGNGTYDAEANEEKMRRLGYSAAQKDTTMLFRYTTKTGAGTPAGWRAWRIRVEQPGIWMIHCHTLQHMVMGKFLLL